MGDDLLQALRQAEVQARPPRLSEFLANHRDELHKLWGPDTKVRKAAQKERWKERARTMANDFPQITPDALRMAWYRARLKQPVVVPQAETLNRRPLGGFALMGPGNT